MSSIDTDSLQIQLAPAVDNYAVFGNPVAHSKSPQIHQAFASQTNQPVHYQAIFVPLDKFEQALMEFRRLGGKGLNITLPFKQAAFQAATTRSARAELAGAVNTISFSHNGSIDADNTDGAGLLRDLQQNNIQLTGKRILVLGAGGAVRGILGPLLEQKPDSILIVNRTLTRAEQLISLYPSTSQLGCCKFEQLVNCGSFDVVINGISAGLSGNMPALPDSVIHNDSSCYDMVYGNTDTVFIQWARQRGVSKALDGLGMLVEQAAEAFYIWRGIWPETAAVIKLLRDSLPGTRI